MKANIRTKAERKKAFKKERNSRSMQRHQAFLNRHSMRRAELGRETEVRVANLLAKKLADGELVSFQHFTPNSLEDKQGKDFQVTRTVANKQVTVSFGITISLRCQQEHQRNHPNEPCIIIPPEMGDERIWQRICLICEE